MILTLNIAFIIGCACCAVFDYLTFKVPNKIILVLLALFVLKAILLPMSEVTTHLMIGLIAIILGFGLYAFKVLGAGDAKFIFACVLWIAPVEVPAFLLATSIAGAVLSMIYLLLGAKINISRQNVVQRIMTHTWGDALLKEKLSPPNLGVELAGKGIIPYGVAIFIGVLYTGIITKGNF